MNAKDNGKEKKKIYVISYYLPFPNTILYKKTVTNVKMTQTAIINAFFNSHQQQNKCLYEGQANFNVVQNPKIPQQEKLYKRK